MLFFFYKQPSCKKPVISQPIVELQKPHSSSCLPTHQKTATTPPHTHTHTHNSASIFLMPSFRILLTNYSYTGPSTGCVTQTKGFSKTQICARIFCFHEKVFKMCTENELPIIVSTILMHVFCWKKICNLIKEENSNKFSLSHCTKLSLGEP